VLIAPTTARERRVARSVFWLLTVAMMMLIYRSDCLGVWSEVVAMTARWLPVSSESSLPETVVATKPTPVLPTPVLPTHVVSPAAPQTVGDLIADIQQQQKQKKRGQQ